MEVGEISEEIAFRGGASIQEECDKILKTRKRINMGEIAVTGAGSLEHCKHIIHVAAPLYSKYFTDKIRLKHMKHLQNGVENIMEQAHKMGIESLSIPHIVVPVHGFTVKKLTEI